MKKYFVLFVVCAVFMAFATAASAQIIFKDVPPNSWAAPAVYNLVKLGIVNGYPDGTFRGNNKITRYEAAQMIDKLANLIGAADLKADIQALQEEVAGLETPKYEVAGSVRADYQVGNLFASSGSARGVVPSYRLKSSVSRDLGDGANVAINLDTMDYGWINPNNPNLLTELLDVETNLAGNFSAIGLENPINFKVTYGPGPVAHSDLTGILPSDDGMVYMRPRTGIIGSTSIWGADLSGGYLAMTRNTVNKVEVGNITATVSKNFENGVPLFGKMALAVTGDYIAQGLISMTRRDMRAKIQAAVPLGENVEGSGKLDIGGTDQSRWLAEAKVVLNDVFATGTVANIRVTKVGSGYNAANGVIRAAEFAMAGLDVFDRALQETTFNVGGEIVQKISDDLAFIGKGEYRMNGDYTYEAPLGALTAQGGVSYAIAPNALLDASYRIFQSKATNDTTDIAAIGLVYEF
ncbi:MAG: S-layer homology domain-containing protein [Candidatus Saganbacteria bacterium]|nr:S-layer homology domain-containing protein [Candidatus Saganbacteria bacterium]